MDTGFENKFNYALSLKNSNKLLESLEIFRQLELEKPNYSLTYVMRGTVYWDLGELENASAEFKKAIDLSPDSEKISLAYFHTLWEDDKKSEALVEEMKRFMTKHKSEKYQEILNGINSEE